MAWMVVVDGVDGHDRVLGQRIRWVDGMEGGVTDQCGGVGR
jgi:hypothetical protein